MSIERPLMKKVTSEQSSKQNKYVLALWNQLIQRILLHYSLAKRLGSFQKMANRGFILLVCLLVGPFLFSKCAVFISPEEARSVLHRYKRYNTGRLEEVVQGNLERECIEETCSYEEAREVFENEEKTMAFWKVYLDGDQCVSNPCQNGGRCEDDVSNYICWCPAGYEGRNCELDATCSTKNGGCKQFCKNSPAGKAICSCAPGYRLKADGRSCEPTVPFPCGRITAPEAKRKITRSQSTFDSWVSTNATNEDLEGEEEEEGSDNTTQILWKAAFRNRVVGGTDSLKGEVPWQVYVLNPEKKGFCGGSIVNEKWIVTAAHCLEFEPHSIVAGEHNVNAIDHTEQYRQVARAIPHPTYNESNKYHNDIALLELESPLEFNHYVTPICIGDKEFTNNLLKHGIGTVSGWGKLQYQGRQASILQVLKVQYIDRPTCLRSSRYTILPNMFCAGQPGEAKDTCQGDSGGPHATDIEDTWFLTGITSWGEQCAKKDKYGIYTRVSRYVKWIRNTTRITRD